ncbi:MAG: AraC family transcriptional regulator [Planctomycetia bacterium]
MSETRCILPHDESVLRECMLRLATAPDHGVMHDIGSEIAARRLVLRLSEILGGRNPDWFRDESVFTAAVMNRIIDSIDARLQAHFCLKELSSLVGCSPSHFARKFRNTAGLSLGRFINRRRLAAAVLMLRDDSRPLAHIALDLGFSSQSHFTRLFSALIGVTPAKYRKAYKRTVG